MKVLWLCNVMMPMIAEKLDLEASNKQNSVRCPGERTPESSAASPPAWDHSAPDSRCPPGNHSISGCRREALPGAYRRHVPPETSFPARETPPPARFRLIRSATLRDRLRKDSLRQQQQKFVRRGEMEKEAVGLAKNVTGRTEWDRFYTREWNPEVNYYNMNETLRSP